MKTLAQLRREQMRFFAKMWREYGCPHDLQLAIQCRDEAVEFAAKEEVKA